MTKIELFRLGTFMDDASYVVLAQALMFAPSYGLIHEPYAIQPTRYPCGFPLMLAPLAGIFPDRLDLYKYVSFGSTLYNVLLLFWGWPYLSQRGSRWWGLGIAGLYAVSPFVMLQTRMVMSESVFATAILLGLILTEKCAGSARISPWWRISLGLTTCFIVMLRTVGAVFLGIALVRLVRRDYKATLRSYGHLLLGFSLLMGAVLALTPIRIKDFVPYEYLQQLLNPRSFGWEDVEQESLLKRVWPATVQYAETYLHRWFILPGTDYLTDLVSKLIPQVEPQMVLGFVLIGLIILGHGAIVKGEGLRPSVVGFEVLFFGVILVWPWWTERFLYPVFPFLAYHFLWILHFSVRQFKWLGFIPRRLANSSATLMIGALVCSMMVIMVKLDLDDCGSLDYVRDFKVGAAWLKKHTPSTAIVLADYPQIIYLYSQRKTVSMGEWLNSLETIEEYVENYQIAYVLTAPELKWDPTGVLEYPQFNREVLIPLLRELEGQGRLTIVFNDPEHRVTIYRVLSEGGQP